jgi:hypothetical protein
MKEADLHRQVCDYLGLALLPPAWFTTFPADGATRRGRIGLKRGVPDILIVHEGRAYWIELKAARGRVSNEQQLTMCAIEAAGARAYVCRSLDDVIIGLRCWWIPIREGVRLA